MIDLNGPAVASNAGYDLGVPEQAVADEKGWVVGKVSLAVIDDQALFAKVREGVGVAVAVVGFLLGPYKG